MMENMENMNMNVSNFIPTSLIFTSSDRTTEFFSSLPHPAWIQTIDHDGALVLIASNKIYRDLFGSGVLKWSATSSIEEKDRECISSCKPVTFEFEFQSPNTKKWKAVITKYPLISSTGALIGIAGCMFVCDEIL